MLICPLMVGQVSHQSFSGKSQDNAEDAKKRAPQPHLPGEYQQIGY
jgi:hypothetical protein